MKRRLSPLYGLIPLLYIAVIFALLYAQFAARERFAQDVGGLSFSGLRTKGSLFSRPGIDELSLKYDLVEITFSGRKPLLLRTGSGEELRPSIRSCTALPQGVQVQFDRDIRMRFILEGAQADRVRVEPDLPDLGVPISSLSFSLQIRSGKAESVPGIPLLNVSRRLFISLPYDSVFDAVAQRITVRNRPEAMGLVLERAGSGEEDPYLHWLNRDGDLGDEARYRAETSTWLEHAYGWWKGRAMTPGEEPSRVEALGAVFLSEALKRGEYPALRVPFYQFLLRLKQTDPRLQVPLLTTPYLGALDQYYQQLQGSIPRRLEGITAQIRRADAAVLRTPDLVRFILDHGPFALTEEVIRLADGVDIERAPMPVLLSLGDTYLDVSMLIGPTGNVLPRLTAVVEKRLLPSLRRTGQGVYLAENGTVDVRQNVAAGRILMEAGEITRRPALATIGQNLVLSCLRFADARGVLPARLTLGADRAGSPQGRVLPEDVYERIARPQYLPREVPLYGQLGPGTWIWTVSPAVGADFGPSSSRFTFSFPVGATHYVLLQGIRPFQTLQLHGTPWKTDPGYYRYSDGWVYDGATQTLFLKLTHRLETEELLIGGP